MDILESFVKPVCRFRKKYMISRTSSFVEYFRCRANGRFIDSYNCAQGKYFECIHYQQGLFCVELFSFKMSYISSLGPSSSPYGMLLSRSCPVSLRFNFEADRCDYPQNVKCVYP